MNITVTGFPAILIWVGFLVVVAAPVWLAARMVGAQRPTLLRSILALTVGLAGAIASVALTGALALALVPLSFLLSFRFVLGTSFLGAIGLAALAAAAYAVMIHFIGSGVTLTKDPHKALVFLTPGQQRSASSSARPT
ncbi:MAG TPA: hypothetical protein VH278_09885 [Burkholderiaceae bacterium]|nr:hypothetical protein [Burkholderiaceae bacterium]